MRADQLIAHWLELCKRKAWPGGMLVSGAREEIHGEWGLWRAMICLHPRIEDSRVKTCGICDPCLKQTLPRSPYHWMLEAGEHRSIPLDQIRSMQYEVGLEHQVDHGRPFLVIIPEASLMSLAGWNILLKVLEEPPAEVMFLVFGVAPRSVPITVRSRLSAFYVGRGFWEANLDSKGGAAPKSARHLLNLRELGRMLQAEKPHHIEDWNKWVRDVYHGMRASQVQGRLEEASLLAGLLIEASDVLGRKRGDGSINLKYELTAMVARYAGFFARSVG